MRFRWRWVALAYLLLLVASHLVRWLAPVPPPAPDPGERLLEVPVVGGTEPRTVRLAVQEWGPDGAPLGPPVLLLHGSPGSHRDFTYLGPALAVDRQVIAPDLPGFGASSHDVPDYSIKAHATYAVELLDQLGIERVHVVGFSMGGGVALELYDQAPERVASLTLMAGIGVQELELLGNYHLNHLLHGLQLAALWLLREGTPHFGALDDVVLSVPYARNFYDSDQRPLRGILQRIEPPVLVLHGERDPLVPAAAAREHARLVPQSQLVMMQDDHFFVFRGAGRPAEELAAFLRRVDAGEMPTRNEASPARRAAAERPFDPATIPAASGFSLVVVMLLLALATLVSEDLTCIGAGLLVADGRLGFFGASLACFLGIYVGDLALYFVGRLLGRPALSLPPLKWWVSDEAVELSSQWFQRRGAAAIFLTRFVPGSRLPTYFAAGALRTHFWRFALYFLLAAALWTPALVGLSAVVGARALEHIEVAERWLLVVFVALALAVVVLRKLVLPLATAAGRRRLVGLWRRWRRWEFWPPWLFYPPVLAYVAWLALRYRGLTVFTAVNPAIPGGGFIGESKRHILGLLDAAGAPVPPWQLLPVDAELGDRVAAVERFRRHHGLSFPLVLKPEAGQRGSGVAVVGSLGEAEAHLAQRREAMLVQEYVPGVEVGVFYVRHPSQQHGRIFSITEKHLPVVVGDGRRTVEELVLADERAVAMARLYVAQLGEAAASVPAPGEEVQLVDVGTHCRGAIFLDGARLASEALADAVDRMSRAIPGFYFGRYDLRAPSWEALADGGPFHVLELNGVTSEATHIYDPRHGLLRAWRTLFTQWRLAYEIGAENRAAGAPVTSALQLLRDLLAYRRLARGR